MEVILTGSDLTIDDVWAVAVEGARVKLSEEAEERVKKCEEVVVDLVRKGEKIYGVTTGIGELARIFLNEKQGLELQKRIIYSHSASVGDALPERDVKAAMVVRANVLAKGYSGVRLSTLKTYIEMINRGVVPMVYEKGSVGTSGDLSPMSQIAEVLLGGGMAFYKGELLPGGEAMKRAGLEPIKPYYKEGLAFINGPQMMAGQAALILHEVRDLLKSAFITSSMSIDALRAVKKAFDPRVHELRGHPGQILVAEAIRRLTEGSETMGAIKGRVQDGYSIRCTPQVLGPSVELYYMAKEWVEREMNALSDNPIFIPEDMEHLAAGNFHGQNVGIAMDVLAIGVSEVANLSERHINRLLNPNLSGLPDFLVEGKGLNSGLMVAQYTAAALVSENKVLSHPASVDSIPVSADQEDHVSMGPVAVRKMKEIVKNTWSVIAIEALSAAQALDFLRPAKAGKGVEAAYRTIRKEVPFMEDDRPLHPDIKKVRELLTSGEILKNVEEEVGEIRLK